MMISLDKSEVLSALTQKQFIPFFQPIHNVRTGACVGAEVLARLQHPERGLLTPAAFLHHLSDPMDLSSLTRELMMKVGLWLSERLLSGGLMLNFNITPNMAAEPWLYRACQKLRILSDGGITVVLELTEQFPLTDTRHRYLHRLRRLRQAGVKLALDDFGTGYAGLSLFHLVACDILKLPREFIAPTAEPYAANCIIDSVITLTKKMGIRIIAEGVETGERLNMLSEKGIAYVQGFYHSQPLGYDDFIDYLKSYERRNN